MKWLIIVFALLVAGAILGPISSGNAGYVLVQFAGWSLETSVIALAIIMIVVAVAISLIYALFRAIASKTKKGGQWFSKRREGKAERLLEQGQLALLQQDYLAALQAFEQAHKQQPSTLFAALASYAAQQCGELGKSEFWRAQAGKAYEEADRVIQIKYIESIKNKEPDVAVKRLDALLAAGLADAATLRLAAELYKATGQWQALLELLPKLQQAGLYSADEFEELKSRVYQKRFIEEGKKGDNGLYDYWRALDKSYRSDATVRLSYAAALTHFNKKEACAKVIYKGLKRGELSIEQVNRSHVLTASYPKLVEYIQDALKRNPQHTGYIRALAQLAYDSKDYSLAQRALKKLVDSEARTEDYKLLGDIYNALGDTQLAANAYKKALA